MVKRTGIVYTMATVPIVLVLIIGVLWTALQDSLSSYSSIMTSLYPYGVFDTNVLLLFNFGLVWLPFIVLLSPHHNGHHHHPATEAGRV